MTIDALSPKKGDKIEITRSLSRSKEFFVVVEWGVEKWDKYWAVLIQEFSTPNGISREIINFAIDCIESFRLIKTEEAKFKILSKNESGEMEEKFVKPASANPQFVIKRAKAIEAEPEPILDEPETDIILRAKKLADLRLMQKQEKSKEIRDHLTRNDLVSTEVNYVMPSFKKRT
jgi:hypothetical protein